jgi:hypothetical protein
MNFPFANHNIRRSGESWPTHPMHGVPMYYAQQGGFVVPGLAVRACSSQREVIDLVDDDAFTGILVNRVAKKSSKTRKRKLVVEPMDDDDDDYSYVKTVDLPVMEADEWSLVNMSEMSDDGLLKGINDWEEELEETFDSENTTRVVAQHDEDGHFDGTGGESLMVWEGGSLSFLDGFKDREILGDFSDDDISAIGDQTDIVTPDIVDDPNRNASRPFLNRPTRVVSSDDETPCIIVQPNNNEAFEVPGDEFVFNISLLPLTFDKGLVVPWDNISDGPSALL